MIGCSIEGCKRPYFRSNLCCAHYRRLGRHGSPTAGTTMEGDRLAFANKAVMYTGDDCLIFPFPSEGYPQIFVDGKVVSAHRYVCEKIHGPQPIDKPMTLHSCHRGKEGCIAPGHLRWGTGKENWDDYKRSPGY